MYPSNVTQQSEGSFSKVSLHLTKLPLKLLLCEENFDAHLFSVCVHLVSTSSKNNPAKNERQQSRCRREGNIFVSGAHNAFEPVRRLGAYFVRQ